MLNKILMKIGLKEKAYYKDLITYLNCTDKIEQVIIKNSKYIVTVAKDIKGRYDIISWKNGSRYASFCSICEMPTEKATFEKIDKYVKSLI